MLEEVEGVILDQKIDKDTHLQKWLRTARKHHVKVSYALEHKEEWKDHFEYVQYIRYHTTKFRDALMMWDSDVCSWEKTTSAIPIPEMQYDME